MANGTPAGLHDPRELPPGVKFDLTDEEILEYLDAKETGKLHPLIDELIPTLEEENGISDTHPERLLGVSKDCQIRHFFHRPSGAYSTGTKKRGRIYTDEDGSETSWRKAGNAQQDKTGGKTFWCWWNDIKRSLSGASNALAKFKNLYNRLALRASEQELPHDKLDDANNDRGSGFYGSTADESIPKTKRRKVSQSKSDDSEGSLLSTVTTPDQSPIPNQTATGRAKGQRMQAQSSINSGAADIKNAGAYLQNSVKPVGNHTIVEIHRWYSGPVSSSDIGMVPPSSVPPAGVHPWGSGKQNADPRPAAQNQNPYRGQVPVNPETVGAHPANQNATPRPADQNQEPNYPGVGMGSFSMNPRVNFHSSVSGTVSINNGITNNFSPTYHACYGTRNHNPV